MVVTTGTATDRRAGTGPSGSVDLVGRTLLVLVGAAAVLVSGWVHFYLYFRGGYRGIAPESFAGLTISRSFVLNAVGALLIAEALVLSLVYRRLLGAGRAGRDRVRVGHADRLLAVTHQRTPRVYRDDDHHRGRHRHRVRGDRGARPVRPPRASTGPTADRSTAPSRTRNASEALATPLVDSASAPSASRAGDVRGPGVPGGLVEGDRELRRAGWRVMATELRRQRWWVAAGAFAGLVWTIAKIVIPLLAAAAIDDGMIKGDSERDRQVRGADRRVRRGAGLRHRPAPVRRVPARRTASRRTCATSCSRTCNACTSRSTTRPRPASSCRARTPTSCRSTRYS